VDAENLEQAVRESLVISSNPADESILRDSSVGVERLNDLERSDTSSVQADVDSEPSRYLGAVSGAGPSALHDEAFPPLPGVSKSARRKAKLKSNQGSASMADLFGRNVFGRNGGGGGRGGSTRAGIRVLNAVDHRSSVDPAQPLRLHSRGSEPALPYPSSSSSWSSVSSSRSQDFGANISVRNNDAVAGLVRPVSSGNMTEPWQAPSVEKTGGETANMRNGFRLREGGSVENGESSSHQLANLSVEDIRAANKALVERIRAGLAGNTEHFADFKNVSALFRKGEMSSKDYYVHIARLGLSYVVPELARLCPDPRKGKELMDAHAAELTSNVLDTRTLTQGLAGAFSSTASAAETRAARGVGSDVGRNPLDFSAISNTSLGTSSRAYANDGEVEVLSSDGYRRQKGKSKVTDTGSSSSGVLVDQIPNSGGTLLDELAAARDRTPQVLVRATPSLLPELSKNDASEKTEKVEGVWACRLCTLLNTSDSFSFAACGSGKPGRGGIAETDSLVGIEKKKKKTSNLLDSTSSHPSLSSSGRNEIESGTRSSGRAPGHGVWNNGGGQRLVSIVQRDAVVDEAWSRRR
jgi:hypothetical protein